MEDEKRNFFAFNWHAFWLALAQTFADKNTVLPGLILLSGGTQFELGLLTSIMIGIPMVSQLLFASYLTQKPKKKYFLLFGIYLRVLAFLGVAVTLYSFESTDPLFIIYSVFGWMFIFSISGAFAGVSYTDILGKSISPSVRKKFFITRQFLNSIGILISALIVRGMLKEIEYPNNYIYMFTAASVLLFIAAGGFLFLKERASEISKVPQKFMEVISSIPSIIRSDSNLRNLVISVNLLSVSFTMIPFYMSLVKSKSVLDKEVIGNFLLFQIIGMILSNFVWLKYTKRKGFKGIFKMAAKLYGLLPILALLFAQFLPMEYFGIVFFIVGASLSAYRISSDSMIIEISNESNRPLYSGIYGTLNLTMAIFPLIIGVLIASFGFSAVFLVTSLLTFSALIFVNRMVCPIDTKDS
ncbi:MAG: MFS transporter [Bacteroidetes bacterium]|nr:MFS transporter [Bacteroidota bacterium]MBU1114362.1 MFS transporter [Bacteroidota bacterium]MBU1797349.1 MFS transporter [Bacteroidota bacterium]